MKRQSEVYCMNEIIPPMMVQSHSALSCRSIGVKWQLQCRDVDVNYCAKLIFHFSVHHWLWLHSNGMAKSHPERDFSHLWIIANQWNGGFFLTFHTFIRRNRSSIGRNHTLSDLIRSHSKWNWICAASLIKNHKQILWIPFGRHQLFKDCWPPVRDSVIQKE